MSNVDLWEGEDVIITIEQEGQDTCENFEAKITSYRRSGGNQSIDEKKAFGNKTYSFGQSREKFTIEMDYITTDPRFTNLHFTTVGSASAAAGGEVKSESVQKRHRIVCWFTPKDNQSKNGSVVVPSSSGEVFRIIHTDCRAVSNDVDFAADDILTGTISFECSATDSDGYSNIFEEWSSTSAGALTSFNTTSHKGSLSWTNTTTIGWTGSYRT